VEYLIIAHCKFNSKSISERILKIDYHLDMLLTKVLSVLFDSTHSVYTTMSNKLTVTVLLLVAAS